ncbi:hypothetical protein QBC35DRAFT_476393 [Podospora australis]|uniref:Uncharacterized protein n=1 Tax=Podospora australis TaxID=1536484 RepID=A0AAN7AG44_9PEZI|nr:hypothetical protein QBC35DRAFT_476393 [Podospora australis]
MPNLVAIDVCVVDDRISLVFSHRAVAAAYAAYLRDEDSRMVSFPSPPSPRGSPHHHQPYHRAPQYSAATKEVTVSLPSFISWFITCRLPDDEDTITFTFDDRDERYADYWAENMVLFERVPGHDADGIKELHVRRLWNKATLLKKLEDLRTRKNSPRPIVSPTTSNKGSPRMNPFNGGGGRGYNTNTNHNNNNNVSAYGYPRMAVNGFGSPGTKKQQDIWW